MTCHDSRNSRRDSSFEKRKSVLSNCLRACFVFALSSRSNHAWFQKNSFKQNIVLCKVEENLCPNFLCYLKGSVDPVLTVKQDLRLDDRNQPIVLQIANSKSSYNKSKWGIIKSLICWDLWDCSVASKTPGGFLDGKGWWAVGNAHHCAPAN